MGQLDFYMGVTPACVPLEDLCVGAISLKSQCPQLRIFFTGFSAPIIPRM